MKEKEILVITGVLVCKKGMEDEFSRKVMAYERTVRRHKGLLMHSINQNIYEPTKFIYYEYWDTEENQKIHQQSEEIKVWVPVRDQYITERRIEKWKILQRIITPSFNAIEWEE